MKTQNEKIEATKRVEKSNYEIRKFEGGYYAIVEKQENEIIFGGDSACEDHHDLYYIDTVYKLWDGTLTYDPIYGYVIDEINLFNF